jgi:hypothetical protein
MNSASNDGVIRVVAAVIEQDGHFLLCQRPAHIAPQPVKCFTMAMIQSLPGRPMAPG